MAIDDAVINEQEGRALAETVELCFGVGHEAVSHLAGVHNLQILNAGNIGNVLKGLNGAGGAVDEAPAPPPQPVPLSQPPTFTGSGQVYFASLDDALTDVLNDATPTGRRCIVNTVNRPLVAAETEDRGKPGEPKVSNVSEEPEAKEMMDELAWLKAQPEVGRRDFELRHLEVPAISVRALWLHNKRDSSFDLLVPLGPSPLELKSRSHVKYSPQEFRERVRRIAEELKEASRAGRTVKRSWTLTETGIEFPPREDAETRGRRTRRAHGGK